MINSLPTTLDLSSRRIASDLNELLGEFPAVVLLGPRQVGKTTLAKQCVDAMNSVQAGSALYLDLELISGRRLIQDPESFFTAHHERLIVLDEVQRLPEIFATLRGVIDQRRMMGESAGQFLLLGSASGVLLKQTSESLAGRVVKLQMTPWQLQELAASPTDIKIENTLWLRGGYPKSYLAPSDAASRRWRDAAVASYLERDIPNLGLSMSATLMERLFKMLAHNQGQMLNQSQLAGSLSITGQAVTKCIDVLVDLMLVRRLPPWSSNLGKRLVRSPKVYVRDSGLAHALLEITRFEELLAHPAVGQSWEGYCVEHLINASLGMGRKAQAFFYRTSNGAECDLVLEWTIGDVWVFEIKRSSAPTVSRGFYEAAKDLKATRKILVAPVDMCYSMKESIEVMSLLEAVRAVQSRSA
jgi:predicted AAA+ superfamily ATPase